MAHQRLARLELSTLAGLKPNLAPCGTASFHAKIVDSTQLSHVLDRMPKRLSQNMFRVILPNPREMLIFCLSEGQGKVSSAPGRKRILWG